MGQRPPNLSMRTATKVSNQLSSQSVEFFATPFFQKEAGYSDYYWRSSESTRMWTAETLSSSRMRRFMA